MSCLSSLDDRRNHALNEISNALRDKSEYCELQPEHYNYPSGVVAWRTTIEASGRE